MLKDIGQREFMLHRVLFWTIHNYSGYGIVGGFAHQGYVGCPYCRLELGAEHNVELGKQVYRGTLAGVCQLLAEVPGSSRENWMNVCQC